MSKLFETRNQHVAVYCVYAGLVLIEVKKIGPKSLLFILNDPESEGAELDRQFYENDSITSARELLKAADEVRRTVRQLYQQI